EGDQLLDDRAQFLCLRQRGDDLLVLDQRRAHVGEHCAAMLGGAVELTMNLAVTHDLFLDLYWSRRFVGHVAQVGRLRSPRVASSEWQVANSFSFYSLFTTPYSLNS